MIQYHVDKASLLFPFLGALTFVILGALIVIGVIGPAEDAAEIDRVGGAILGWITIIFFGAIMLVALRYLPVSNADAVIKIDDAGFYDRRLCIRPIPWSAIRSAHVFHGRTGYAMPQKFLSLDVDEPQRYVKPGLDDYIHGLASLLNSIYDVPGVTISTAILGRSPDVVLASIQQVSKGMVNTSL